MPTAHTALSAAFNSLHTAVGNGAMRKSVICLQWSNEHLRPRILLFSVGNNTMNAPWYWQWHYESSAILVTAQWCLWRCWDQWKYTTFFLSQALFRCWQWRNGFHSRVCILFPNSQSKNKEALSQDGRRTDFSGNLRESLFNDEWAYFQPDPSRWTVPLISFYSFLGSNILCWKEDICGLRGRERFPEFIKCDRFCWVDIFLTCSMKS